jgi:hypothetical protein
MFNDAVFQTFCVQRPIAVMSQLSLCRLLDAEVVDEIFADHAEEQYQRKLLFSSLTKLMSSVVMSKHASVNAAYKKMKAEIGVSLNAVYNKLDRVEPGISRALVQHSYQQVVQIRKGLGGNRQNDLPGYRTRIFDGNHIAKTEHRLKETRDSTSAPLPGKSVVVLDPRFQAIVDVIPIEDGHAQERTALDDLLATVEKNDLWIGDRNFCTLKPIYEIESRSAAFIIRHHAHLVGDGLGKRKKVGRSEAATVYERTMTISNGRNGPSMVLRRIEVELDEPTRKGDEVIVILTNLPAEVADGLKVAELYRTRWKIETAFQVLTTSLNCEINTLCYPKAALFVFSLALVAYNSLAVVEAAIAKERGREFAESMSHYYMALEIAETTDGMLVALPVDKWIKMASVSLEKFNASLCKTASHIDLDVYKKSNRGPKKPKKKKNIKNKPHVSTAKILAQRKRNSAC